jgi:hypothetical protein
MRARRTAPAERRLLLRLLRLALRGPLEVSAGAGGGFCLKGADTAIADVPAGLLREAVARGLIVRDGLKIRAGEGTVTYLRRAMAEPGDEAFLGSTATWRWRRWWRRVSAARCGETSPIAAFRPCPAEGPFGRRLPHGADAIAAGERLAADFGSRLAAAHHRRLGAAPRQPGQGTALPQSRSPIRRSLPAPGSMRRSRRWGRNCPAWRSTSAAS